MELLKKSASQLTYKDEVVSDFSPTAWESLAEWNQRLPSDYGVKWNHAKVATKWAENLIEAIDRSRTTTLERFLYALGIQHVGESTAKALATWFGDIELIRHLPWPLFKRVPDVGGEVARSIGHFLDQPGNQQVIDDLLERGVTITDTHRAVAEAARWPDAGDAAAGPGNPQGHQGARRATGRGIPRRRRAAGRA